MNKRLIKDPHSQGRSNREGAGNTRQGREKSRRCDFRQGSQLGMGQPAPAGVSERPEGKGAGPTCSLIARLW